MSPTLKSNRITIEKKILVHSDVHVSDKLEGFNYLSDDLKAETDSWLVEYAYWCDLEQYMSTLVCVSASLRERSRDLSFMVLYNCLFYALFTLHRFKKPDKNLCWQQFA